MGAAAVSSKPEVEMIVFLAIMLHKAPAAFGLTTFLLEQASSQFMQI
jgi:zinc transporter 9